MFNANSGFELLTAILNFISALIVLIAQSDKQFIGG